MALGVRCRDSRISSLAHDRLLLPVLHEMSVLCETQQGAATAVEQSLWVACSVSILYSIIISLWCQQATITIISSIDRSPEVEHLVDRQGDILETSPPPPPIFTK